MLMAKKICKANFIVKLL